MQFGDPAAKVRIIGKSRREIRVNQVPGQPEADNLRAQTHHVHIVVLHGLMCAVPIVQNRRANTSDLVGVDGGADAGAADHDAPLSGSGQDLAGSAPTAISEIDGVWVVGAHILDRVAALTQMRDQRLLQRKSSMIGANDDAHVIPSLPARQPIAHFPREKGPARLGWLSTSSAVSSGRPAPREQLPRRVAYH